MPTVPSLWPQNKKFNWSWFWGKSDITFYYQIWFWFIVRFEAHNHNEREETKYCLSRYLKKIIGMNCMLGTFSNKWFWCIYIALHSGIDVHHLIRFLLSPISIKIKVSLSLPIILMTQLQKTSLRKFGKLGRAESKFTKTRVKLSSSLTLLPPTLSLQLYLKSTMADKTKKSEHSFLWSCR